MKMVHIRRDNKTAQVRTRPHWGADFTSVESISKKSNILITGAHHSGKSRAIQKLYDDAETIWSEQIKPYSPTSRTTQAKPRLKEGEVWTFPEPVLLNGVTPLSIWHDNQGMADWWEAKNPDTPYKKVQATKRVELIASYLKETRAVLFVDDAHKLNGRKLQIAKACIQSSYRCVVSASTENKLPPSIRRPFLESKPQHIQLNSEVAYDATHLLIWFFVFVLMMTGMTELAALLGLLEAMKGGRNASRQD
jgi:hypothetical protein